MIGMGLMATPTAQVRTSLIPCPMRLLSHASRQIWWTGLGSPCPLVRVSRQESTSSSKAISSSRARDRQRGALVHEDVAQLAPQRVVADQAHRSHAGERVLVVGAGERVQGVAPVTQQVALLGPGHDEGEHPRRRHDRAHRVHARPAVGPRRGQEAEPDAELVEQGASGSARSGRSAANSATSSRAP